MEQVSQGPRALAVSCQHGSEFFQIGGLHTLSIKRRQSTRKNRDIYVVPYAEDGSLHPSSAPLQRQASDERRQLSRSVFQE